MRHCYAHKYADVHDMLDDFAKLGREGQKGFFQYAIGMVRETMLTNLQADELVRLPEEEHQFVRKFSPFVSPQNAERIFGLMNEAWYHIERNCNPKIVFFDTSLQLSYALRQH
jgi:DNA polymerase-3 subunit delta'